MFGKRVILSPRRLAGQRVAAWDMVQFGREHAIDFANALMLLKPFEDFTTGYHEFVASHI